MHTYIRCQKLPNVINSRLALLLVSFTVFIVVRIISMVCSLLWSYGQEYSPQTRLKFPQEW